MTRLEGRSQREATVDSWGGGDGVGGQTWDMHDSTQ